MPFTGEISLVTARLEHRSQGPLRFWQTTALALEGHGGHTAAVGEAPRNHSGAPRRAAWLRIEGEEGHAFVRHAIQVRRRHAATRAATIDAGITIPEVIGDHEDDV